MYDANANVRIGPKCYQSALGNPLSFIIPDGLILPGFARCKPALFPVDFTTSASMTGAKSDCPSAELSSAACKANIAHFAQSAFHFSPLTAHVCARLPPFRALNWDRDYSFLLSFFLLSVHTFKSYNMDKCVVRRFL